MKRLLFVALVLMASLFKVLAMTEEESHAALLPTIVAQSPQTVSVFKTQEGQDMIGTTCERFQADVVLAILVRETGNEQEIQEAEAMHCVPPAPEPPLTKKQPAKVASR